MWYPTSSIQSDFQELPSVSHKSTYQELSIISLRLAQILILTTIHRIYPIASSCYTILISMATGKLYLLIIFPFKRMNLQNNSLLLQFSSIIFRRCIFMGKFVIDFKELSSITGKEAIDSIKRSPKKRLGEITLYDLIFETKTKALKSMHGVYLFFSLQNKCKYVGKCSSRHFITRIPAHLALGDEAWMNTLLKKMMGKTNGNSIMDYQKTAKETKEFGLLLIPVAKKEDIFILEKFLRLFMCPELNSYSDSFTERHENIINLNDPLRKILKSFKK